MGKKSSKLTHRRYDPISQLKNFQASSVKTHSEYDLKLAVDFGSDFLHLFLESNHGAFFRGPEDRFDAVLRLYADKNGDSNEMRKFTLDGSCKVPRKKSLHYLAQGIVVPHRSDRGRFKLLPDSILIRIDCKPGVWNENDKMEEWDVRVRDDTPSAVKAIAMIVGSGEGVAHVIHQYAFAKSVIYMRKPESMGYYLVPCSTLEPLAMQLQTCIAGSDVPPKAELELRNNLRISEQGEFHGGEKMFQISTQKKINVTVTPKFENKKSH